MGVVEAAVNEPRGEYDDLMRRALYGAAGELQSEIAATAPRNLSEADLKAAFRRALRLNGVSTEARVSVPTWPKLGAVDVAVGTAVDGPYDLAAELKWGEKWFDWTLWDACKLAALLDDDGARSAYLIAAAPERSWAQTGRTASGIRAAPDIAREMMTGGTWAISDLWASYRTSLDYSPRPNQLPHGLVTSKVGEVRIQRADDPDWLLRCASVRLIGGTPFDVPATMMLPQPAIEG